MYRKYVQKIASPKTKLLKGKTSSKNKNLIGYNEVDDSNLDMVEKIQFDVDTCNSNVEAYVDLRKDNPRSETRSAKVLTNEWIMIDTKHMKLRTRELLRDECTGERMPDLVDQRNQLSLNSNAETYITVAEPPK